MSVLVFLFLWQSHFSAYPIFFLLFFPSQCLLFWKALFQPHCQKRVEGEMKERRREGQENYPSLSSVYSKHFTGNCCSWPQIDIRVDTHTHTHKPLPTSPLPFVEMHHWIEKENTRHWEIAPKSPSHTFLLADTCQIKSKGSNAKWCTFSFSECVSVCMFTNRCCFPKCLVKPSQRLHSAGRNVFVALLKMPLQGNFLFVGLVVSQNSCSMCVQWRGVVVCSRLYVLLPFPLYLHFALSESSLTTKKHFFPPVPWILMEYKIFSYNKIHLKSE